LPAPECSLRRMPNARGLWQTTCNALPWLTSPWNVAKSTGKSISCQLNNAVTSLVPEMPASRQQNEAHIKLGLRLIRCLRVQFPRRVAQKQFFSTSDEWLRNGLWNQTVTAMTGSRFLGRDQFPNGRPPGSWLIHPRQGRLSLLIRKSSSADYFAEANPQALRTRSFTPKILLPQN
jgi:hypothetical protein